MLVVVIRSVEACAGLVAEGPGAGGVVEVVVTETSEGDLCSGEMVMVVRVSTVWSVPGAMVASVFGDTEVPCCGQCVFSGWACVGGTLVVKSAVSDRRAAVTAGGGSTCPMRWVCHWGR